MLKQPLKYRGQFEVIVMREQWLNGWPRSGGGVLIGTAVHCAGCGKYHGITCVAFSDDWEPPEKMPDWPYEEDGCPLCERRDSSEFSIEEVARLGESVLRKAMIIAKTNGA